VEKRMYNLARLSYGQLDMGQGWPTCQR
jgi:hypothetical protein